jgi:3'-phosphoadenosine 5'-phosphosulfate sulfotransferase (PAPS reductase)/FAD synthetase
MKKVKVVVAWSGGKDSQASLIWAVNKYGNQNVVAVFCDTGWENPITLLHVVDVCEQMGIQLEILRSKKYVDFVTLAERKKRFPSSKARFCTEELKTKPMIDWILDQDCHLIIIQGIRADESEARKAMSKQCQFFKYYYQPYTDNIVKYKHLRRIGRKKSLTTKQKARLTKIRGRLRIGKLDEKYHTYRKKEVIAWRINYDDTVERPFFYSTSSDVMNVIFSADQKPNRLYYMGRKRVGCDPCIMENHDAIKAAVKFSPDTITRLELAEIRIGGSFFPPDYIPKKYMTKRDVNGKRYPCVKDVITYLTGDEYQQDLFVGIEVEQRKCMSFYGICE